MLFSFGGVRRGREGGEGGCFCRAQSALLGGDPGGMYMRDQLWLLAGCIVSFNGFLSTQSTWLHFCMCLGRFNSVSFGFFGRRARLRADCQQLPPPYLFGELIWTKCKKIGFWRVIGAFFGGGGGVCPSPRAYTRRKRWRSLEMEAFRPRAVSQF